MNKPEEVSVENLRARSVALYRRVVSSDEGQGLVEYALILVFVSILSVAVLTVLGVDVDGAFETVESAFGGNETDAAGAVETD